MSTERIALANRLLCIYSECPALIQTAPLVALRALCSELDPNGEYDNLSVSDVRQIVTDWAQDEYHIRHR